MRSFDLVAIWHADDSLSLQVAGQVIAALTVSQARTTQQEQQTILCACLQDMYQQKRIDAEVMLSVGEWIRAHV